MVVDSTSITFEENMAMKSCCILMITFLASYGGLLPSDAVVIGVKFQNQVAETEPFKSVVITVEDVGKMVWFTQPDEI